MTSQLGFKYSQLPRNIRRQLSARSILEKIQRFPELIDLLQTWWPGARIAQEIKDRTGWLIPGEKIVFSLRRLKNRASLKAKSLCSFGLRGFILFKPDDAQTIVNEQANQIQRFKTFCQRHLGIQPPRPRTLKEAQVLSRRYSLTEISRRLGIRGRSLSALIRANKKTIAAENFNIIGLCSGVHARVVAAREIEEFFCKLGQEIGGEDLSRPEQIRRGKKFSKEAIKGNWKNWWPSQKISRAIRKRQEGWLLKPAAITAHLREEQKRHHISLRSLKEVTGRKLNVVPKDVAKRIVNEQVGEIRRLRRFCQQHLSGAETIDSIDQARQIWTQWNIKAASQRFGIGLQTLNTLIKKGKIRCQPFRIIGLHRQFKLVSERDLKVFLRSIQAKLRRLSPDPSNPLTLEEVPANWYTVNRIREEITDRTKQAGEEWHIKDYSLCHHLKKKTLPVFKLRGFTKPSSFYIEPGAAQKLIVSQSAEIKRLQQFVQEHLGDRSIPYNSQTALALIKKYGIRATQRTSKISECQFQRLLKQGLFRSERFSIIGLGSKYRLFFPEKTLKIQRLIQAYQNPTGKSGRDIWSELVRTGLRHPKEFRWVIDNSEEEAVRTFRASKPGKMLIGYLEKSQNRRG